MDRLLLAKMTSLPASVSDRPSASFDLLSEPVRHWIWQQGWDELHDIQERSIPVLLHGRSDVIIAAPTAAGKTEATFLPLISRIAGCKEPGFKVLYLSPLKSLINDQFRRLDSPLRRGRVADPPLAWRCFGRCQNTGPQEPGGDRPHDAGIA